MKFKIVFGLALFLVSIPGKSFGDGLDAPSSPDKHYRLTDESSGLHPAIQEASQTATLYFGHLVCWRYETIARKFYFSWAPDSSGFLFGITHITRSMSLYYVHIEDAVDVYPVSIDLDTIDRTVAARLQDRHGNSAPKSGIDWDTIKWTSAHTCRMVYFQRILGQNADSILELELKNPMVPTLKILSIVQR